MAHLLLPVLVFAIINIVLVLMGYLIIKHKLVAYSWLTLLISLPLIHIAFVHQHVVLRMLALIAVTFTAMKIIAATVTYRDKPLKLTFKQWAIFALCWAGMRPQPFESLGQKALPGAWPLVRFGLSRLIAGMLLIVLMHLLMPVKASTTIYVFTSVALLVGLSLILHFGILSISAGMWRLHGADTYLLFRQPAMAGSLTEFWSKRWNLAFSEMTALTVFRPLKKWAGSQVALTGSFIFSGLLHEVALSVPVNSGYGLPTLYFIIQALLVMLEKVLISHNVTWLQNKLFARLWLFFWLVVPMPLLFHSQFIKQIVWPLAGFAAQ